MAAAASAIPRPSLYGIGACLVGTELRDFEIGWDEFERDTDWATSVLTASGIQADDLVLITSPSWQLPWLSPIAHGLRRIGAVYTPAECFNWDARRANILIEGLRPKAFIGLGAETLEGLGQIEVDPAKMLSGLEIIWARHDALKPVAELGFTAHPFVPLGPALAFGIPGVGTVVNSDEWTVSTADGELMVSTAGQRATTFADVKTGLHGTVGSTNDHGTIVEFDG